MNENESIEAVAEERCKHETFKVEARVARLHKEGSPEKVTSFHADIEVMCADCFMPFTFIGLPGGFSFDKPTVSFDGLKAQFPIKPI